MEIEVSSDNSTKQSQKNKIISFIWQHVLLVASLFLMTFGVALCVQSSLGSSVISSIPFAMTLAGDIGKAPQLTIGDYTNIMNIILVAGQILILRRSFEPVQLFQLIIGFLFGFLLDLNMAVTSIFTYNLFASKVIAQVVGCTILGLGISFELRCGSITMPGEGFPAAISKKWGIAFPKTKICVDILLVLIAVAIGYFYFGLWLWNVVGPGTLFAMIFVGLVVRFVSPRIKWFDRVLLYKPGFRRYIYGLARYVHKHLS